MDWKRFYGFCLFVTSTIFGLIGLISFFYKDYLHSIAAVALFWLFEYLASKSIGKK